MPIYRGCIYSKAIQFKTRSTGQPLDITTWQFEADLKDGAGATVLAMSTAGGQFTVFDGENGWMRFSLTTDETEAMDPGPVTFGLYRIDSDRTHLFRASDQVREQD